LTKIYLIRHAEAEGNIYRRAHGHHNGLITIRGYKQIERLKKRFEDIHIDAVYSSDLSRACTTATALSDPRELPIIKTEKLREVKLGIWEDNAWGDIEYRYREMSNYFSNDPKKWIVEDSELYENVKARMFDFITETAKHHKDETIAFFSHGFAIRSLMCLLDGVVSNETAKIPYYDNTAVTGMIYDNGTITVKHRGCASHLDNEISTLAHQTWWRPEIRKHSENLRFLPLNKVACEELLRIFKAKAGERAHVDVQYAAFLEDEPVGILGIDTEKDNKRGVGWISYIHVIPHHRKKTYATQLLGLAVSDFRKLKREKIRIELPAGSMGTNFMTKCGFDVLDVTDKLCLMEKTIKNW